MAATIIIPARYASTRLPGKVLLDETGKFLIQHVVESIGPAKLVDRIVIAADDQQIVQATVHRNRIFVRIAAVTGDPTGIELRVNPGELSP